MRKTENHPLDTFLITGTGKIQREMPKFMGESYLHSRKVPPQNIY